MKKTKLIRITTIPLSLKVLLRGQLKFMSDYFEVIGVSSREKELEDVKKDEGIAVVPIEMSRKITPVQDIKSLIKTYKYLKKEQPQIVHTHTPKAGIVGMLGAKLAGVPIRLHTVAGLPLMEAVGVKRKVLDFVEKLTYSSATKVYPNSKGLYDFILQNSYTSVDKLKVIGEGSSNGIDTNHFSPIQISEEQKEKLKKELNIQANDFVFVFVGRLVGDKGINELVKAFQKLSNRNQESETLISSSKSLVSSKVPKLLLVGPLESELDPLQDETLKEIEINPAILTVGFQKDVRPYFAISHALVFPSYREGFPNVVMQAGAMELPSIVSDINGCNEIIIEGRNGTIIPVKSSDVILIAMQKMIDDKDFYNELKKNARPMIQARYEQSVVWNALLEEYNKLIKEQETRK
ncbi:glycosyltransferase family 4 protein [Empedobacter tilapiae]|uniref:glycosyltransferase family 4 protein n=1 Tax=Empedobacter tilapiae TaxID=2491114 RepID=UPI0028D21D9D|nr:glycosyltransferase family 4 protein [Empedobacter tilapiae]